MIRSAAAVRQMGVPCALFIVAVLALIPGVACAASQPWLLSFPRFVPGEAA